MMIYSTFASITLLLLTSTQSGESGTITQSEVCTPEEISEATQCFHVIPQSKYEAAIGSSIELDCSVRNLRGKVQWRANRLLLGYNRNITSHPNMKMVGDDIPSGISTYNLRIQSVSSRDSGIYECQVTPFESHKLLRRETQLIVLKKPSIPVITGMGLNGGNLTIEKLGTPRNIEITCTAQGGVPDPNFTWYRTIGTSPFTQISSDSYKGILIDNNARDSSTLTIRDTNFRSYDRIKCEAINAAVQPAIQSQYNVSIQIIIHEPPGDPQINNIRSEYNQGETLAAMCSATPAGVPTAGLFWQWELHNGEVEDISRHSFTATFQYSLLKTTLSMTLTKRYHNANLACRTRGPVGKPKFNKLLIKVNFPPDTIKMSSMDPSNSKQFDYWKERSILVVDTQENSVVHLSCETASYYGGNVLIHWELAGNTGHDRVILNGSTNFIYDGKSDTKRSVSNLTISAVTSSMKGMYVLCKTGSPYEDKVDYARLNIIHPPEQPKILNFPEYIKENETLLIKCHSQGGNPTPNLFIYKNGDIDPIASAPLNISNEEVTLIKSLYITRLDNKRQFYCKATNKATGKNGVDSVRHTLTVLFPPRNVNIRGPSKLQLDETEFSCHSESANPPAVLSWRLYECEPRQNPDCRRSSLHGIRGEERLGDNQGYESNSKTRLMLKWQYHGNFLECTANSSDIGRSIHNVMKLNIEFPPKFPPTIEKMFVRANGTRVTIDLQPRANPPISKYIWYKGDEMIYEGAELYFKSIEVKDSGQYTLRVQNALGFASRNITVNVTYSPVLKGPHEETVQVKSSGNGELRCEVQSNPNNPSFIWILPTSDNPKAPKLSSNKLGCNDGSFVQKDLRFHNKCQRGSFNESFSTLNIYSATPNDIGEYLCLVNNSVGEPAEKKIYFIVPFKPAILKGGAHDKEGGQVGKKVTLSCSVRAEPQPTFRWFKLSENKEFTQSEIVVQKIRLGRYIGSVEFEMSREDFGRYKCQATNNNGSDSHIITLIGTTKPDLPINFRLVEATTSTITMAWTQGFNGGYPQTFKLLLKPQNKDSIINTIYQDKRWDELRFTFRGLLPNTDYIIKIKAENSIGSTEFSDGKAVKTKEKENPYNEETVRIGAEYDSNEDNALLIIVAACVFGFVILVINILVISFLVKRRGFCNKQPKRGPNEGYVKGEMVELFPRTNGPTMRGMPDDQKTFSSYDTGCSDEQKEDLLKKQELPGMFRAPAGTAVYPYPLGLAHRYWVGGSNPALHVDHLGPDLLPPMEVRGYNTLDRRHSIDRCRQPHSADIHSTRGPRASHRRDSLDPGRPTPRPPHYHDHQRIAHSMDHNLQQGSRLPFNFDNLPPSCHSTEVFPSTHQQMLSPEVAPRWSPFCEYEHDPLGTMGNRPLDAEDSHRRQMRNAEGASNEAQRNFFPRMQPPNCFSHWSDAADAKAAYENNDQFSEEDRAAYAEALRNYQYGGQVTQRQGVPFSLFLSQYYSENLPIHLNNNPTNDFLYYQHSQSIARQEEPTMIYPSVHLLTAPNSGDPTATNDNPEIRQSANSVEKAAHLSAIKNSERNGPIKKTDAALHTIHEFPTSQSAVSISTNQSDSSASDDCATVVARKQFPNSKNAQKML